MYKAYILKEIQAKLSCGKYQVSDSFFYFQFPPITSYFNALSL